LARGDIADGEARVTAVIAPGTRFAPAIAKIVGSLAWQGKLFERANGRVANRILPFGLTAVTAKVYEDRSRLDGRACIVLDYSETSLVARWVRDELRPVAPGLWLGKALWPGKIPRNDRRLFDFVL